MTQYPWQEFLSQWSQEILDSRFAQEMALLIPDDAQETRWLGYAGASEQQITAAEQRLKVQFPPSYRQFLAISNGWSVLNSFTGLLWPTDQIELLTKRDRHFMANWGQSDKEVPDSEYFVYGPEQDTFTLRKRYIRTALQISDPHYIGSGCLILNPQVVTADGEWEAWSFATWYPGAIRYRSFWELMQGEHKFFSFYVCIGSPTKDKLLCLYA
jgi:hypothetical protein